MRRIVGCACVLLLVSVVFAQAQTLSGAQRADAQKSLEKALIGKMLVAKTTFPAWKDGIDLKTDGTWNTKWATRMIKDHGVGIEPGDRASITAVKVKDDTIEVHLNGGGAGTMMDSLMTSDAKRAHREASGGKAPGGSRINLHFEKPLTAADVADLGKIADYLEPLVETASLRQEANRQNIPAEFKDAAARGEVVVGMDKATVFAIMGEPKTKSVDTSGDIPIEKWVFELKNLKTRVVTFKAGKAAQVQEF